jgi:ABC-2 type transport system ATP-binding protein
MTENQNDVVIRTRGLTKQYEEITALADLDLTVHKNSIFGFLGPNGAGKTTTIKALLGLIRPTAGSATVFGHDVVRDSLKIRARVGYLPQDPRFYDHMTARETLDFTARFFFKGPEAAIKERVNETLELVGLEGKADRPIDTFSGGERQRVGIGQAQVNYPDLLILDEPAASLDPLGRRDVLEVMETLRKYTTVFYSTHILDDVQRVSDSIAILNNGRLVAQGEVETLLAGSGGTSFTIKIRGDAEAARARVEAQDWATATDLRQDRDEVVLTVSVGDPDAAERQLLRLLLADKDLVVRDFRRKTYDLEEVFLSIVEGGTNGG